MGSASAVLFPGSPRCSSRPWGGGAGSGSVPLRQAGKQKYREGRRAGAPEPCVHPQGATCTPIPRSLMGTRESTLGPGKQSGARAGSRLSLGRRARARHQRLGTGARAGGKAGMTRGRDHRGEDPVGITGPHRARGSTDRQQRVLAAHRRAGTGSKLGAGSGADRGRRSAPTSHATRSWFCYKRHNC